MQAFFEGDLREAQKPQYEKNLKKFEKSIDKRISDVIYSLSCLAKAGKRLDLEN